MLINAAPGVEDIFSSGPVTGYIGFDPTAPSMTIGNLGPDHCIGSLSAHRQ